MRHKCIIEVFWDRKSQQTILKKVFFDGLMRIMRPFYLKDWMVLQIITLGPGLVAGDIYELEVKLAPFCRLILLNQSATKVLTSPKVKEAKQILRFYVREKAELEYYPGLLIPFPKSFFSQELFAELEEESYFGYLELLTMGRIACKEAFNFSYIFGKTEISKKGIPLYKNTLLFDSKSRKKGIMEDYFYLAEGFWTREVEKDTFLDKEDFSIGLGRASKGGSFLIGVGKEGFSFVKKVKEILNNLREGWGLPQIHWERYGSAF